MGCFHGFLVPTAYFCNLPSLFVPTSNHPSFLYLPNSSYDVLAVLSFFTLILKLMHLLQFPSRPLQLLYLHLKLSPQITDLSSNLIDTAVIPAFTSSSLLRLLDLLALFILECRHADSLHYV